MKQRIQSIIADVVYSLFIFGAVFIGLRIEGFLTWSWWIVTLPITTAVIVLIVWFYLIYREEREHYG